MGLRILVGGQGNEMGGAFQGALVIGPADAFLCFPAQPFLSASLGAGFV